MSAEPPDPQGSSPSRSGLLVGNGGTGAPGTDAPAERRGPADHLKAHRFEKGKSGNPGGRPKGRSIAARLRELLDQEHHGKEIGDILAERLIKDGLQGKLGHVKEILDRTEGAAKRTVEVQGGAFTGMVIIVPPEGATEEEARRYGAQAAARLPAGVVLLTGRCWLTMLEAAARARGARIGEEAA